ncbi:hypothetical protein RRG08_039822 [Elysia crispata]|uniref:Reverse transcriptase domain-containing protein n=1 Tax=Elysia crispata TaxID=231223 RepID=A0AAE1APJ5_9GAST|nr:hypothetical protein RRG08_039822 [Elysia crispata]
MALMEEILTFKRNYHNLHSKEFTKNPARHKTDLSRNLLEVINKWTEALDEGKPIDAVYLDFAKAFDSVPHQRLILKIDSYSITSKVQSWIRAFLTNRRQRVSISGSVSEWSPVTSGVPQGSILGPVLFVIFINDLPDVLNSWCQMYADDTKVSTTVDSKKESQVLQKDIDRLVEWADRWQLHFNAAKCKVIHLGRNNPAHKYTMKMHNSEDRTVLELQELKRTLEYKWMQNQIQPTY